MKESPSICCTTHSRCVSWLTHMCAMTHSHVWHVCHDLSMSVMTHPSVFYHEFVCATCRIGWRRLIGSPKLQIIFHKRATKYRSLLRKMTYKDKGSYESSPPCIDVKTLCPMSQDALSHSPWITRLTHMCVVTHSHVCHDSCICILWCIHTYDLPYWCRIDVKTRWHMSHYF